MALQANRKSVVVGQLGSKLGMRSRAAVAIATALLNDVDVLMIHHIDRVHDSKQREKLFTGLNELWVKTGGLPGMRKAPRTVIVSCDDGAVPESAEMLIRLGAGEERTGVVIESAK